MNKKLMPKRFDLPFEWGVARDISSNVFPKNKYKLSFSGDAFTEIGHHGYGEIMAARIYLFSGS